MASVHGLFADEGTTRVEKEPRTGVKLIDSYLCVRTAGKYRVFSRDDMIAFSVAPCNEALLAEFILSCARQVSVTGDDGVAVLQQAWLPASCSASSGTVGSTPWQCRRGCPQAASLTFWCPRQATAGGFRGRPAAGPLMVHREPRLVRRQAP